MYIPSKFNSLSTEPDWVQTLDGVCQKTAYDLNCMRIGIVWDFFAEDLTADVIIANKKTLGLNEDGTPVVTQYPVIRAKVVYCNPFCTYPIERYDECVLLFADREIESWFINGEINPEAYPRMHAKTDAVALFGIRSIPNMIEILTNALHLFYGNSDIQIQDSAINYNSTTHAINGATNITGNTTITGVLTASSAVIQNGATGTFKSQDNKIITVTNGIITAIAE